MKPSELGLEVREYEVLIGLSQGLTNRQIADGLGLRENTVKHYLKGVYKKLGVANGRAAAAKANELDLLPKARRTA
jgi:DNA-binding NarL/FixJ family response regulator